GNEAMPVNCYTDPGTFDVTLTIVDQAGCEGSVTLLDAVNVEAVPVAAIGVTPSVAIIDDPIFQFTDLSTGASERTWHFGDPSDSTSSAQNTAFAYPFVGCYSVLLEVSNAGGCSSSATIDLCVEDSYAFYAPNAFTANNDGFNDGFMVSTTVRNPEFFELKIFDRWGQQVATINKQLTPWNGDGVPLGVYVWQARVKDSEGQMHEHRGSVTLLR
ncbi:MAG: gliding motility-associated C-terminal domain-containing protein, partial [Flavobacteriales bacterium]|nr:gliding motility-associated C-terminal domain-containing protein [Flavobacteriales bacterium]